MDTPDSSSSQTPDTTPTPVIQAETSKKSFPYPIILGIVIILVGLGALFFFMSKKPEATTDTTGTATPTPSATATSIEISVKEEGKLILPGGYADPTVVATTSGYRMYVNRQSGGPGGYLTYTSPDGITWTKEKDIIISGVATGRAVTIPTGIRFYYPGVQPINPADPPANMFSSFSSDGVTFTKDDGIRLEPRSDKYYVEGPTVFQLPDNSWRMYFNENTVAAGNQRDGEIWGASSPDGLTWTRDSAPTLKGDSVEDKAFKTPQPWKQVLHPFVVKNPKGGYIMFYNSHSEVFYATSQDGLTWKKQGDVGVHGADVDGYFMEDGNFRIFYGDFSEKDGGLVYIGVLKVTQ